MSDQNERPIVREGDTMLVRYDSVRVIQKEHGEVDIEFRWRGMLTHTMRVDCDFASGQQLNILGIEGKSRLFNSR